MVLGELFTGSVLPFLLVFVLIFAILQKSKVLGDGNARIDALVSLAIALILILTPYARDVVVNLVPWIAVGAAALLVFFVLYGFVAGDLSGDGSSDGIPGGLKVALGILIGIFAIVGVIFAAGFDDEIWGGISGGISSEFWTGLVMAVIVVGAFFIAVYSGKGGKSSASSKS